MMVSSFVPAGSVADLPAPLRAVWPGPEMAMPRWPGDEAPLVVTAFRPVFEGICAYTYVAEVQLGRVEAYAAVTAEWTHGRLRLAYPDLFLSPQRADRFARTIPCDSLNRAAVRSAINASPIPDDWPDPTQLLPSDPSPRVLSRAVEQVGLAVARYLNLPATATGRYDHREAIVELRCPVGPHIVRGACPLRTFHHPGMTGYGGLVSIGVALTGQWSRIGATHVECACGAEPVRLTTPGCIMENTHRTRTNQPWAQPVGGRPTNPGVNR